MIRVAAQGGNRQPQAPDGFHIRAASSQPVRVAHVQDVLLERLSIEPAGQDVRGFLHASPVRLLRATLRAPGDIDDAGAGAPGRPAAGTRRQAPGRQYLGFAVKTG